MEKYLSKSENETKALAEELAKKLKGHIFALTGELGAGKTVFAQGFARGLGIKDKIISPTFVLIRQHKIPHTNKTLYHIDLYRLENITDLESLGLSEILTDPQSIVLIEWAEKAGQLLPEDTVKINISKGEGQNRIITIF